jgi:hypothetical protein
VFFLLFLACRQTCAMSGLRCGTSGVSVAEQVLLKTLFRLYAHGATDFRWRLVDEAPYDALLVDESAVDITSTAAWQDVKAILRLGGSGAGVDPDTIVRPIRSERLLAWLLQAERESAGPVATDDDTTIPLVVFAPVAATITAISTAATVSAPTAISTPTTPVTTQGLDVTRFKLVRWPPSAMLRNDPRLIRMATMLSRRLLSVGELAQVSQQAEHDTQTFVQALRSAGLLDIQLATPTLGSSPLPKAIAAASHVGITARKAVHRGLVSRIRQRLGL